MNSKKKGILILWISIVICFTSLVFFVIGCNSFNLVNDIARRIALTILILSVLAISYAIFLLIRFWHRKTWPKVRIIIISVVIAIYVIGCSSFLFLLYGPYQGFRNWLITTAMSTMNHQYYCKWFYNDDTIKKVMGDNYIDDGGAETDTSLIDYKEVTEYANEYEKEILERDKDDLYKVIQFKVNGCKAYLGVVYDASKIEVGLSKKIGTYGEYAVEIAKRQKSVLTINGGGFNDPNYSSTGGNPIGITIKNSKVITDEPLGNSYHGLIGFNKDNILVLKHNITADEAIKQGIREAVTMGPFLIVNGKPSFMKGNGGWGYAARSAIGQRKDGIVLFLVVDSNEFRSKGASMVDLTEIMQRYGAINAANLDGGTSSVMIVDGTLINDPIDSALRHKTRPIPTVFSVVE